ncbi:MAG: TRAP transporter permease, partial [Inquilinus sp.]|nr:TRAP transporter permease [Inquilinus sp.]
MSAATDPSAPTDDGLIAHGVDDEPPAGNQRRLLGWQHWTFYVFAVVYAGFHLYSLNIAPLETWTFRILHIAGALMLGFALLSAWTPSEKSLLNLPAPVRIPFAGAAIAGLGWALFCLVYAYWLRHVGGQANPPSWVFGDGFGWSLSGATAIAIVAGWAFKSREDRVAWCDWVLMGAAAIVCAYLLFVINRHRMTAGTPFAQPADMWATLTGTLLILELTRRAAGLALVVIAGIFVSYAFLGPFLPGFLEHGGFKVWAFFPDIYT